MGVVGAGQEVARTARTARAATAPRRRAVLYSRLSVSDDTSTSIARQLRDLRALAEREDLEVVAEFVDDGVSGRTSRANATGALQFLRERRADVLVVWKFDRWSRQGMRSLADLIDTLDEIPTTEFVALQDGLRSAQPAWRIVASVLAEVARMESENTATRVRSSIQWRVEAGLWRGGQIPFGYQAAEGKEPNTRTLIPYPPEVAVIEEMASALITGLWTPNRVTEELNQRQVPTGRSAYRTARNRGHNPDGLDRGIWRPGTVMQLWTASHLIGRQVHRGELVRDDAGIPKTVWPPLVDRDTYEALRAAVRDPRLAAGTTTQANRRRSQLLSGLLFCAECGSIAYSNRASRGQRASVYTCSRRNDPTCPKPTMSLELVDAMVTERFLKDFGACQLTTLREPDAARVDRARLADVEQAIDRTTDELRFDGADLEVLLPRLAELKAQRTQALVSQHAATTEVVVTEETYAERWGVHPSIEARQGLLRLAFDRIVLSKLAPGAARKGSHPERLAYSPRVSGHAALLGGPELRGGRDHL
ncbi:hypothetical protein C5E10_05380 [Pseudoclavibacter sp. RFBG4]|uniref:recombinase family protein n=1 Tax=Pseudoclavibacter sp. RFBG4 TaxID=2080575 RepID=UPI000CE9198A|nr:recombinase family protein [Pseudoclavibacter sp. RFBG4]PPG35034.1 hypothetical protein C5E10_05380 [Pseudoclavibacter sp. RFBG4]